MLPIVGDIIGAVIGIGADWLKGKRELKRAKIDSTLRINESKTEAQQRLIAEGQKGDIAWENTSLEQAGWKDEYWTIVLSIPLILCFFPQMVGNVLAGFEALQQTPLWYRYAVGVAIGSAFGVRTVANFMKLKKGD